MKQFSMAVLFFLTGLCCLCLFGCSKSNEKIVRSYQKAHNNHDISRAMELYSDDITFELKGVWIKQGKDAIHELEVWDSVLNSHLDFRKIEITGDSVYLTVIEKNDWFMAFDIPALLHDPTIMIIESGKIKKIVADATATDSGRMLNQRLQSVMQWAQETSDPAINDLFDNGEFLYSPEAARKWMELSERWQAAKTN